MSADFEKLLSKAFAEYAGEEFGKQAEIQYYPISKKELKWAKAQDNKRRYKKPMWQINLQRCAAILLIFCSLCAVVFATNVEVRAFVTETFSQWFNSFINIFYTSQAPNENADIYLYDVTYIPEGFEQADKTETENARVYIYENGEKRINIEIAYTKNATVSADSRLNSYEEIWLGAHSAHVLYDKKSENGAVIFGDASITVAVEGNIARDELIKIAYCINMNESNMLGFVREFEGHKADLPKSAVYSYKCSIWDFSYADQYTFEQPITVSFSIPESWSNPDHNVCERTVHQQTYTQIASASPVVLYEVSPDFVLDCSFHETQVNKYAISHNTFVGKNVSEYRTESGLDCVIYYQYDDADNIFLTAFVRLSDTLIMEISLNDDSSNTTQMLDILDTLRLE